jgi:hypothetical protein
VLHPARLAPTALAEAIEFAETPGDYLVTPSALSADEAASLTDRIIALRLSIAC